MKPIQYSSLTAFLEHYKALESSSNPTADERSMHAEMEKLIDSISPDVRLAFEDSIPLNARRRQRVEREVRRELLVRGVLTG